MREQYADKEHKFDVAYWYTFFVDQLDDDAPASKSKKVTLSLDEPEEVSWAPHTHLSPSIYEGYSYADKGPGKRRSILKTGYVPYDVLHGRTSGLKKPKKRSGGSFFLCCLTRLVFKF